MGWFSDAVSSVSDAVSSVVDTGNSVLAPITSAVPNPFTIVSNAVGDTFGGGVSNILNTSGHIVDTAQKHPVEVLGVAYGGSTAFGATEAGGTEALSGIDLGGAGASPASWTNATTATMTGSATSGWTAGQIASTVSSGLNLATSGVKLAALGKSMNASTATSSGLTGALATSPIQTPSGLITTTPQGPVSTGAQSATSGGFMGMDTQTLMVIAFAAGTIWYLMKQGK